MSISLIHLHDQTSHELGRDAERPSPSEGRIVWLNVSQPTEDDLAWLERTYHFHPLAIEDCRHFNQRAKVESYDGYLFLSLLSATRDSDDIHPRELEVFLGPDYLITVHREDLPASGEVMRHIDANSLVQGHPDFLLWMIVDRMVDAYFPLLDEMEDEI